MGKGDESSLVFVGHKEWDMGRGGKESEARGAKSSVNYTKAFALCSEKAMEPLK